MVKQEWPIFRRKNKVSRYVGHAPVMPCNPPSRWTCRCHALQSPITSDMPLSRTATITVDMPPSCPATPCYVGHAAVTHCNAPSWRTCRCHALQSPITAAVTCCNPPSRRTCRCHALQSLITADVAHCNPPSRRTYRRHALQSPITADMPPSRTAARRHIGHAAVTHCNPPSWWTCRRHALQPLVTSDMPPSRTATRRRIGHGTVTHCNALLPRSALSLISDVRGNHIELGDASLGTHY